MPRPVEKRCVKSLPSCGLFKPAGVRASELEEVALTVDEYEMIRLVDFEGMYQEQAAEAMGVSRQTIGRVLDIARKKVAEMLVTGKALRIEGGEYVTGRRRRFRCESCQKEVEVPYGEKQPEDCPSCKGKQMCRCEEMQNSEENQAEGRCQRKMTRQGCGRGHGQGRGQGHGQGQCRRGRTSD